MSLWGMIDRANNSPFFATAQVNLAPTAANANAVFGNTTFGVFLNNGVAMKQAVGSFGIDVVEAGNTVSGGTKAAHAGWNLRTAFTGPLSTITVTTVGKLYTNGDIVTVNPGAGLVSSNATAVIATNASGNIISTSITSVGAGFTTTAPTSITVANSTGGATTGSNAVFTAVAGGRAGRVQLETLVAAGTITDDSDGTIF
jgi:hypothetical protein